MTRLLLTMGDPAGIGPEVLLATLSRRTFPAEITVVGDLSWLKSIARRQSLRVPWDRIRWVDVGNVPGGLRPGKVQAVAGKAAHAYLEESVRRIRDGQADALVTAPVSKQAIVKAGIPWVGHTEFLADTFHAEAVMMFVTGRFRVSLVTTHVAVGRLPSVLTKKKVIKALQKTYESLIRDFKIRRPRIGLAALNPHAGEGGLFGHEEQRILTPALSSADAPPGVKGPVPADSLIREASAGRYDAIVAIYHDQALVPVKLLGWEKAVNVTLGLPFVRTSPVHGTAFDLAGGGGCDHRSMSAAIDLAIHLARHRSSPRG